MKDAGWLMAAELLSVGIDISFAPVLDIGDSFSDVIADRSFSQSLMRLLHWQVHGLQVCKRLVWQSPVSIFQDMVV